MGVTLFPDAAWRGHAGLPALFDALGAAQGDTRLVGGFVRDTLLGHQTADIDLATRLSPETVVERIRAAGFKAVPTGIAHGTITAVLPSGPVEVTTLRKDVSTDGRRATIAYTDDWREDAARRDFTINALSVDPQSGTIYDYFSGLADLDAGLVRFIGDPLQRIAEDHLRILRFFRFHARFGRDAPDAPAIDACAARANDLMALSRERIADELLKLLALPVPGPTIALMVEHGIWRPVLPEIAAGAGAALDALADAEHAAGIPPAPLRRLSAILPRDAEVAQAIAARLKLSNAARKRLGLAASCELDETPQVLAYRIGMEGALDRLLLAGHAQEAAALRSWDVPRLPAKGGDLVALGIKAGPAVAAALRTVEERWIAEGFPGPERVEAMLREVSAG